MRKQIIICDGCGNIIEEEPLKFWVEYTDRETGEYSLDIQDEVTKKISSDKEYCRGCIKQIGQFLKNLPGSSTKSAEKPINPPCEVDSEPKAEKTEKNEKNEEGKSGEKPIKTECEVTSQTNIRDGIRKLIKAGKNNQEIIKELNCKPNHVYDERCKMKKREGKSGEKPINPPCEVDSEKSAAAVRKVVNCTPEVMKKCKYGSTTSPLNTSTLCCDYLSKVGHSRGCNPTECDKFEKRK